MGLRQYQYIELIGLAIVLIATTFQITLLTTVDRASHKSSLTRIEEKLNIIWFELQDQSSSEAIKEQRSKDFNFWIEERGNLDRLSDIFNNIYAYIMIAGSFLLVLGRHLEMLTAAGRDR